MLAQSKAKSHTALRRSRLRPLILLSLLVSWPLYALQQAPQKTVEAPRTSLYKFDSFHQFRDHLLQLIGAAERQIILSTKFLTDGDISSALYLAQYRKVEVRVLLGRRQVNSYLSRLRYLKAQNIPVYLIPPNFPFQDPTTVLIDNRLFRASVELNSLQKTRAARLQELSPKWIASFVKAVKESIRSGYTANPTPLPMVGRKPGPRPYRGQPSIHKPYAGEADGSYNYDRSYSPGKAPAGIPTRLPKTPLFKKSQAPQIQMQAQDDGPTPSRTENETTTEIIEKNLEPEKEANSELMQQENQPLKSSTETEGKSDGQASTFAPAPTFNRLEGGNYNSEDSVDGSR